MFVTEGWFVAGGNRKQQMWRTRWVIAEVVILGFVLHRHFIKRYCMFLYSGVSSSLDPLKALYTYAWCKDHNYSATQAEFFNSAANLISHSMVQCKKSQKPFRQLLHYGLADKTRSTSAETKYLAMCFAFTIRRTWNQCILEGATIICGAINCVQVMHYQAILE